MTPLKYIIALTFLAVSVTQPTAQYTGYPEWPERASSPEYFIPFGWRLIGRCQGDLKGDGHTDHVLILRSPAYVDHEPVDRSTMLLLVLFYDPAAGDYYIVARSENIRNVPKRDYDGYTELETEFRGAGTFIIHYKTCGSYSIASFFNYKSYFIRYLDERFELYRMDILRWDTNNMETESIIYDYIDGTVTTTKGNTPSKTVPIQVVSMPTLESIDGLEGTPLHGLKIAPDFFRGPVDEGSPEP